MLIVRWREAATTIFQTTVYMKLRILMLVQDLWMQEKQDAVREY